MQLSKFALLALCVSAISTVVSAQDVLPVDAPTLAQHLEHRVDPVYPPIAKAARIQGAVIFQIQISPTGKVESMKVTGGPAMLMQAAKDCLKQWTYRPFEKDGAPVAASGPISIEFSLGKDAPTSDEERISKEYFPASDECRKAVSAGKDYQSAAKVCKQAADLADEFAPDRRFIEKRSGFVWAAWALAYSGDLNAALTYATKAVEIVKLGHDDNSGSSAAYGVKGIVEGKLGQLPAADQDLAVAEDFQRKGIAWAEQEKFDHGDSYKRALVQELTIHAQVLQGLNEPIEAQKKLDEAAKLK